MKGVTPLIQSVETRMIGSRFRVKASSLNNGVDATSIMVVTEDLLEKGLSVKFFKSAESVAAFLKLLQAAL